MSSMRSKVKVKRGGVSLTDIKAYKIVDMNKMKDNIIFDINITICIHCYDIDIFTELMLYIKNFFEFKWKNIQFIIHHIKHSQKVIENIIEDVLKDVDKNIIKNNHLDSCVKDGGCVKDGNSVKDYVNDGNGVEDGVVNDHVINVLDYFKFIKGENIGVDIGGFMRCLDEVKDDDDIVIKIHTKSDDIWRRSMMNIFTVNGIYTSMKLLESKNIGMIGSIYNIEHFRKKFNPQFNINQYYIPMIKNICNEINIPLNE
jgi:hypothetical protein